MSAQITLLSATTITSSSNLEIPRTTADMSLVERAIFVLDCPTVATDGTDLLDMYVQYKLPNIKASGIATWHDFIRFTQVAGDAAARHVAVWEKGSVTTAMEAQDDAAMSAGVKHGMVADDIRLKWVVTSGNAPSFLTTLTMQAEM